jgi:hypothetical protein
MFILSRHATIRLSLVFYMCACMACMPVSDTNNMAHLPTEISEVAHNCMVLSEINLFEINEIKKWLTQGCYLKWDSESDILQATASDSYAQIFINPILRESLINQNTTHPLYSAAVRVMYQVDQESIWGYAVSLKTMNDHNEDWFWFEQLEHQEQAKTATFRATNCIGCHTLGMDLVQSVWPLR